MHNNVQAKLLLDSTLENIEKYKLTPVPDNYRLWFEYASGSINGLNQEVEQLISQQKQINDKVCRSLYNEFIVTDDRIQVDEARLAIANMLQVMIENLKDWDSSTNQFCNSLSTCASKLTEGPSLDEVKVIVEEITNEARRVRNANHDIHNSLHSLTEEIEALRQDVDRLGNEALTDPLTQVANRRGLDSALKKTAHNSLKNKQPMALLMADIDHFKRVNDKFGHTVGDKVLRFIAAMIKKSIRSNDITARYGGEEFAIILPNTSLSNAKKVAENICAAVSAKQLTMGSAEKTLGRITLSIGATEYQPRETLEQLVDRADRAMYTAKSNGRNRVICN